MTIKARFVGDKADPKSDPDEVSAFGVSFIKGEWTDVPKTFADKIAGNTHFEIDREGTGEADPTIEDLRAQLDAKGIKYSPRAGIENLKAKLADAGGPAPDDEQEEDEPDPAVVEARNQLDVLGVEFEDSDDLEALTAKIEEATKPA